MTMLCIYVYMTLTFKLRIDARVYTSISSENKICGIFFTSTKLISFVCCVILGGEITLWN